MDHAPGGRRLVGRWAPNIRRAWGRGGGIKPSNWLCHDLGGLFQQKPGNSSREPGFLFVASGGGTGPSVAMRGLIPIPHRSVSSRKPKTLQPGGESQVSL